MIFLERGESMEDETKSTVTIIEEVCEDSTTVSTETQ